MLIYLADLAHTYSASASSQTVPLGIGYIKAYAMEALGDEQVEILLFKHPEKFMNSVTERTPDVIGFANYGWNEHLNLTIGKYVRELAPDALIVAGGPNIDPDLVRQHAFLSLHAYLDFLIIDGGEEPFSELVQWWQDASNDEDKLPPNIIWMDGEEIRNTGERKLEKTIDYLPSPYLSGYLDEFLEAGMVPLMETNRGCPFRCTFCAWGMAAKDLVRRIDLEQVFDEIEHIGAKSDAANWIICDANFGLLKRDVNIAKALRSTHDKRGRPLKCHAWLAKNVTERNLEIANIMGDMTVPVMAVQSMSDEVLRNVKRDNISNETYIEYQQKFHAIGSKTYSDLIVPLPAETLSSHMDGLRQIFDFDVDIIQNHNMRLLAGAETNSTETREEFGFKTRFRLIHGDAGVYRTPNGGELRSFECEESLRSTTTMSEDEVFFLRKLHFAIDFSWNNGVYKRLLRFLQIFGHNPVDVLTRVVELGEKFEGAIGKFWHKFEEASQGEWFDSEEDIRKYFSIEKNFSKLINLEYEKLNIQFSAALLSECKGEFDVLIRQVAEEFSSVPEDILDQICGLTFPVYPPIYDDVKHVTVPISENLDTLTKDNAASFVLSPVLKSIVFQSSERRELVKNTILCAREEGQTLSKILNVQQMSLRELALMVQTEDSEVTPL